MKFNPSRREHLKRAGSLTVLFSFSPLLPQLAFANNDLAKISVSLQKNPRLSSWVRLEADGSATIFTGKAELGQGIRTALLQIAADELDLDLDRVAIAETDTDSSPNELDTSRSHSVIESGGALRAASADARAILLDRAAKKLGVNKDQLTVTNGVISSKDKKKQVSYGELIEGSHFTQEVSGKAEVKNPSDYRYVGTAVPRIDIPGKVFGDPMYVQDVRLENMVHGRVCRPATDHVDIRLTKFDPAEVETLPGVIKVVRNGNFVGVIAEREEQAIAAAEKLAKTLAWELPELPEQKHLLSQLMEGASTEKVLRDDKGVAAEFDRAKHQTEAVFFMPFQAHGSIGPSCAVAQFEGDELTVWSHSQGIFDLRTDLAQLIGHPQDKLNIKHVESAGCYGQNGADDVPLDAILLAKEVKGRPVRVQWMQHDEFATAPKGPAMVVRVRAGADDKGNIVAWDHDYWCGPHIARYGGDGKTVAFAGTQIQDPKPAKPFFVPGAASDVVARAIAADDILYNFPNKRIVQHALPQFTPLRSAEFRGVGGTTQAFAEQVTYDQLAHKAGIDPIQFRLQFMKDERMREVLKKVAEISGWDSSKPKKNNQGRGVSFFYYDKPFGRSAAVVEVTVDQESGAVSVDDVYVAVDVGLVINPDGLTNQIEGGVIQMLSRTLKEEVKYADREIKSLDWLSYPILRFSEIPNITVAIINRPNERAGGVGEVQTPIIPGAVANAIFDATQAVLTSIPFTPDKVKAAISAV